MSRVRLARPADRPRGRVRRLLRARRRRPQRLRLLGLHDVRVRQDGHLAAALVRRAVGRWCSSVSSPQPGDLVFVYNGGGGSVGHVAIYAGGGYWWEAANPSVGRRPTTAPGPPTSPTAGCSRPGPPPGRTRAPRECGLASPPSVRTGTPEAHPPGSGVPPLSGQLAAAGRAAPRRDQPALPRRGAAPAGRPCRQRADPRSGWRRRAARPRPASRSGITSRWPHQAADGSGPRPGRRPGRRPPRGRRGRCPRSSPSGSPRRSPSPAPTGSRVSRQRRTSARAGAGHAVGRQQVRRRSGCATGRRGPAGAPRPRRPSGACRRRTHAGRRRARGYGGCRQRTSRGSPGRGPVRAGAGPPASSSHRSSSTSLLGANAPPVTSHCPVPHPLRPSGDVVAQAGRGVARRGR